MVRGKFISLNTRGIGNYRKRRTIFTWLRKQKPDVVFLQETHSTQGNEVSWQREWGATLICPHGANNARGVAILIRNNFDCVIKESVIDTNGRFIILKVLLSGEPTLLVNIYGPNRDNELRSYTCSQSNPLIFSRLDYWLISNSLSDNVCHVDMISAIKTDHSAIVIELQDVEDKVKGPGFWKLNCSLLNDKEYVNELNLLLPT